MHPSSRPLKGRRRRAAGKLTLLTCLLIAVTAIGCRPEIGNEKELPTADDAAKKKKAAEKEFQVGELQLLPHDDVMRLHLTKPGHWAMAQLPLKANRANFTGQLESYCTDRDGEPIAIGKTLVYLREERPAVLPKGQSKALLVTFLPTLPEGRGRSVFLRSNLVATGGQPRETQTQLTTRLLAYQNYLLVLAKRPDSYAYLKTLPSVRPPTTDMQTAGIEDDYAVILPKVDRRVPLPDSLFAWTTLPYIVWDDFDASLLTPSQQRALREWLAFGGQLIISGPGSLDSLQSSFLASLLPARSGETGPMNPDMADQLNRFWLPPQKGGVILKGLRVDEPVAPTVVRLRLRDGGTFLPNTADGIAERRIGRGRIVVTSFRLTAPAFVRWDGLDNLFNACLLRRPPRRFVFLSNSGLSFRWAGTRHRMGVGDRRSPSLLDPTGRDRLAWSADIDGQSTRYPAEALINSKIRFLSRDGSLDSVAGSCLLYTSPSPRD